MVEVNAFLTGLMQRVRKARESANLTPSQLEEKLILGQGWVNRFESGETIPSLSALLAILEATGTTLSSALEGLPQPGRVLLRNVTAEQDASDLIIRFPYGKHDAEYKLSNASLADFEGFLKQIRDGLAAQQGATGTAKRDSVVDAFLDAVGRWPTANPSDLWWFLVSRAYCDPYNHPAKNARLDLSQSWKRTGGWALEEIVVRHYGPFLKDYGINIYIADAAQKEAIVASLKTKDRIESDKIDVVLTGDTATGEKFFGVVHVKASFAERRTDDVHLSSLLKAAGYTTPLWTMDCKSTPGNKPVNRGELGPAEGKRSAKRRDIEDEGYFTRCFSYNANTLPSSIELPADRRVYVCSFTNPDDQFSTFIRQRWSSFYAA